MAGLPWYSPFQKSRLHASHSHFGAFAWSSSCLDGKSSRRTRKSIYEPHIKHTQINTVKINILIVSFYGKPLTSSKASAILLLDLSLTLQSAALPVVQLWNYQRLERYFRKVFDQALSRCSRERWAHRCHQWSHLGLSQSRLGAPASFHRRPPLLFSEIIVLCLQLPYSLRGLFVWTRPQ